MGTTRGTGPSARVRGRLAWGIAFGSIALVVLYAVYSWTFDPGDDPVLGITVILATAAFGVVGAIIAARTGNPVGWALLAVIGALAVSVFAQTYATYSTLEADRPLPLATFAVWVGTLAFFLSFALIVAIPLLYPTGTPRWRWVWRLYLGATTVFIAGWAILPQELSLLTDTVDGPANPFAIEAWEGVVSVVLAIAGFTILACAGLSAASLIVRYRTSHGEERQQVKWLAYVGIAAVVGLLVNIGLGAVFGSDPDPGVPAFVSNAAFIVFLWIVVFGIPAACGVAILKYRLYDLDVVVRKTVVFTLVAATLTIVYLAVLALATVGQVSRVLVGIILLVITFRPVRRTARALADRLVYGRRASAYEVLTEFSGRVGDAYATEDVLPRMAQILGKGAGATSARVLLRVGADLRAVAVWPVGTTSDGEEYTVPVVHQGQELGVLAVTMPSNDPIDASRERLITDLAAQAGLVLRNVRLIEELRASRQRLVAAQDEERRKIERNLHDGAQQQLVALGVQLGLAHRLASQEAPQVAELLDRLRAQANDALDDLRDLARGIYPPLLADKGLAAAIESQARRAAVPTTMSADGVGRYLPEIEAAVYFCTLEALNNVAKYADASRAEILLDQRDGKLTFRVADDGVGFDAETMAHGTGLQGMRDRLDAIGGKLVVESATGHGTTITGTVPVRSG